MSANYQQHHWVTLQRARDHLSASIQHLTGATEIMLHDDVLEVRDILEEARVLAARLTIFADRASDRRDEYGTQPEAEAMRTGELSYPDQRPREPALIHQPAAVRVELVAPSIPRPPGGFPNVKLGEQLITQHGSIDAALLAIDPETMDYQHLQAARKVRGLPTPGWTPTPAVRVCRRCNEFMARLDDGTWECSECGDGDDR